MLPKQLLTLDPQEKAIGGRKGALVLVLLRAGTAFAIGAGALQAWRLQPMDTLVEHYFGFLCILAGIFAGGNVLGDHLAGAIGRRKVTDKGGPDDQAVQ